MHIHIKRYGQECLHSPKLKKKTKYLLAVECISKLWYVHSIENYTTMTMERTVGTETT